MINCRVCGTDIKGNAHFCGSCGTLVVSPSPAAIRCPACGQSLPPKARFCGACGQSIAPPPIPQQSSFAPPHGAATVHGAVSRVPPRAPRVAGVFSHRGVLIALGILGVSTILAVTLLVVFDGGLFFRGGADPFGHFKPFPPGALNTPAVDVRPAKGVRIKAPAGALDRDREFTATWLDGDRMQEAIRRMPAQGDLPVMAFDLEAGMKPEETLPRPFTVNLDLRELAIPEDIWPDLSVMRLEPDGTVLSLITRLDGSRLLFSTRKNSVYILVLLMGLLWERGVLKDASEKFPNPPYISDQVQNYTLWWPEKMLHGNAAEVERVQQETETVMSRHGWDPATRSWIKGYTEGFFKPGPLGYYIQKWREVNSDPEYRQLSYLVKSLAWRRDNYWPPKVSAIFTALERADEYLRSIRKFRMSCYPVDVILVKSEDSPLGEMIPAFFLRHNVAASAPYMQVNTIGNLRTDKELSELNMTMVHELFHVSQIEYMHLTHGFDFRLAWFSEATALELEYEANEDYFTRKWSPLRDKLTDRNDWDTFRNPLQDPGLDRDAAIKHGYTASVFLDYLRDDPGYNTLGKEGFLPAIMESSGGFLQSPVGALYAATSRTPKELADRFLTFCKSQSNDMMRVVRAKSQRSNNPLTQDVNVQLTPATPVYEWRYSEENPLSTSFRVISLSAFPADSCKDAIALLINGKVGPLATRDVYHRVSTSVQPAWKDADGRCEKISLGGANEICLQRIEAFVSGQGATAPAGYQGYLTDWLTVLVLAPPKAPTVEQKDDLLRIEFEPTELKRRGLVSGYNISVITPSTEGLFVLQSTNEKVELETGKAEGKLFDLKLRDKKAGKTFTVTGQDMRNLIGQYAYLYGTTKSYRVFYQEVVEVPGSSPPVKIPGPPSAIAEVRASKERPKSFDVFGTWEGPISLTGLNMNMVIGPGGVGYDIKVVQQIADEPAQVFFGKASQEDGRIFFELYIKDGSAVLGPMQKLYMLPEGMLAMFGPNVTLSRKGDK